MQPLGTPVAFQPFTMPLLRRPEEPIFRAITTQAEWEALLQELALRPGETPGGRGRSTDDQPAPTAVPGPRPSRTPAARGLVRGEAPNFRQEVLFLAMLEQESTYRRVEITDVRRQGSKVYVQVRLVEEKAAPGLPTWASAAVTVLRRALPQDFSTAVVFVSEEGDVLHTTRLFKR
ncbi:MAG: hypothetical protein D6790_04750 [Caldilineae bacterium]|nr:MAG: hypothetical protein D6790_04750 [Caldilineae bacterium]